MAKMTTRGRVTIPKALRDKLGLTPGAEVEFRVEDGAVRLRKLPSERKKQHGASRIRRDAPE
jgi:AbrB family looped-hinge helix DNA binding protein